MKTEDIYGDTSGKKTRKVTKLKKSKIKVEPTKYVNTSDKDESEDEDIEFDNVFQIPEDKVNKVLDNAENVAITMSDVLLEDIIPLHLGLDQAFTYSMLALRDGLDMDIELENDIDDIVGWISKIVMIYTVTNKQKLPLSIKKQIMSNVVEFSMENLFKTLSKQKMPEALGGTRNLDNTNLQGQIVKNSKPPRGSNKGKEKGLGVKTSIN